MNYAKINDVREIKKIWDICFDFDDNGYNDYYFNHLFDPENTLVIKENDEIVSVGSRKSHIYMLNNRPIMSSMIYGIATKEQHRHKGHMKKILNMHLDQAVHQEIFTFIQAYNPDLYLKFGFKPIYYKHKYTLTKSNLKHFDVTDTRHEAKAKDLLDAYATSMKRFDGYMIRDLEYFENLIKEVRAQNGTIISSYDKNGKIKGYAVCYRVNNYVEVSEIIYFDILSLIRLVTVAINIRSKIILHTTIYEKIDHIFENAEKEKYVSTLVRINDYQLFNRLFNTNVNDAVEAFNSSSKPLFLNEII